MIISRNYYIICRKANVTIKVGLDNFTTISVIVIALRTAAHIHIHARVPMFDVRADMVEMKTKLKPKCFPLSMRPAWLCAQRIVSHRIASVAIVE